MMPLWVPLLVIAITMVVGAVVYHRGVYDEVASCLSLIAMTGPAMVLLMRLLKRFLPASLQGPPPINDWILLLAPLTMILVLVVVGFVGGRRKPAPSPEPQTTCSRCNAGLFEDHTGRGRYYSEDANRYLCPNGSTGDRRHHPVAHPSPAAGVAV
ncbi:hypothetical protein [Krasilnikovia sp. MM14-A1259]|uniref:hypothetical protein n=1 Tax=Krasilnikovia sp. MM14-A1259 TaxID=3373539 RepID=UPI003817F46A